MSVLLKTSNILSEWGLPQVLTTVTDTVSVDVATAVFVTSPSIRKEAPATLSNETTIITNVTSGVVQVVSSVNADQNMFAQLGRKYTTDKILRHGYHRFYPRFIDHYMSTTGGGMLEIGVDKSHSLNMWLEYFPNAFIYGMDKSSSSVGMRYEIYQGDQSKLEDLHSVVEQLRHPLFLIVDDGSHYPDHQILGFNYLFNHALLPGGTYIIEDIETSYWTKNGVYVYYTNFGFEHPNSAIEILKSLADSVNEEYLTVKSRAKLEHKMSGKISLETRQQVQSVMFGHNCVIITKKVNSDEQYLDRTYMYINNL